MTLMAMMVSTLRDQGRHREEGPQDIKDIRVFHADESEGQGAYFCKHDWGQKVYRERFPRWRKSALYHLITDGVVVIRNMLPPTHIPSYADAVSAMEEKESETSLKRGQYNFGNVVNQVDKKRFSLILDETNEYELAPWRVSVLKRVEDVLRSFQLIGFNHKMEGMTLLKTLMGAVKQFFHSDYPTGGCFRNIEPVKGRYDKHPCTPWAISVLIAIDQDGATLELSCGQLVLNCGDAVVFSGDLRHAGSGYTKDNVRLHVYYGYEDLKRSQRKMVEMETDGTRRVYKSDYVN